MTFKDIESKDNIMRHWIQNADEGEALFRPIEKIGNETYTLTLEGIPLEYPDDAAQQYLCKYLHEPTVTKQRHKNRGLFNGIRLVTFTGIKRPILRKLYVGPSVSGWVKSNSFDHIGDITLKCSNCQEYGHLQFDCKKETVCTRCKEKGHNQKDCL